jgi:hypothetical protein
MAEMGTDARFACDPEVVGKVIDGEAIIINLASGMYYSADEVGGLIWTLFESGHSIGEVASHVGAYYQVDAGQARADVERIAARLVEEGLIQQAHRDVESPAAAAAPPSERRAYTTPSLEVYRDMKDLLALDPPMQALKRDPWDQS